MEYLWLILPAAVVAFLAVVLVRTLLFRPAPETPVSPAPVSFDRDKVVEDMVAMVRCKTVSYRDAALVDWGEFAKFQALLKERFPLVHQHCTLEKTGLTPGNTGLLYRLPGRQSDKPTVLMSHYDVVPVEEDGWSRPAFDGLVEDGYIWGRGTLDTKGTLCGVMEALETRLAQGYVPENDLYLAFSGEEEIDGGSCPAIVRWLEERGITPALVVDEGGAVVDHVFPGVDRRCALIGTAEKGSVNLNFTLASGGGHSSTPPPHTILGQLSRAVTRIEDNPFRRQLTQPVREMFDTLGRHSDFLYRMIFANLWCFAPVLDMVCKKSGGELNALMRTTVAVTRMEGSRAYNVLPPKASFGINMRLLGEDTIDSATAYLHKVMGNEAIQSELVTGMNPSPCSDTHCEAWDTLCAAISETWTDAIVSPYLMMACSDSRHYCRITDKVYRFSAMYMSKETRGLVHGHDERVKIEALLETVEFYIRLLDKV